jgi:hypothetical protein
MPVTVIREDEEEMHVIHEKGNPHRKGDQRREAIGVGHVNVGAAKAIGFEEDGESELMTVREIVQAEKIRVVAGTPCNAA